MLSEGEDDVLWLETKPSQVKLDVPRGIKLETARGRENLEPASAGGITIKAAVEAGVTELENHVEEWHDPVTDGISQIVDTAGASSTSDSRYGSVTRTDTSHILVDAPPVSTSHAQIQPKKRGRKKKSFEAQADQVIDIGERGHSPESSNAVVTEVPEDVSTLAMPEAKKGRLEGKVADIAADAEHANQNTESESDASLLEENQNGNSRPALTAKDPNPSRRNCIQSGDLRP